MSRVVVITGCDSDFGRDPVVRTEPMAMRPRSRTAAIAIAVALGWASWAWADGGQGGVRPSEGAPSSSACTVSAAYEGPARRDAPASLWAVDYDRPIAGELPSDLRAALDRALDDILTHVPAASVAVAIPGRGTWTATRGLARTSPPVPAGADDLFQVASVTKTFTAAVVLQLVEEKRLSLDSTVDRWFPDVPNARAMTVEDLLRHTCGLISYNALPDLGSAYRSPVEAIGLAAAQPPMFCPGTRWVYTNTGYAMLGQIVERLEGKPLRDVFAARLLGPLGLEHTVLRQAGDEPRVVAGYKGGQPAAVEDGYATAYAAGGLASTAGDLVRFWHALLSGRVLPRERVRSMFTDMVPMDPAGQTFYGVGVELYDPPKGPGIMLGHSGGIKGFTSVVTYVAADDLYIAVAVNDKSAPAEAGLWALLRAIRAARAPGEQPARPDARGASGG